MKKLRMGNPSGGAIDASWFDTDLRQTSGAWRLMHAEEAADSGDFVRDELEIAALFANGWPEDAPALLGSAWWVAEALWRNGVAASVLNVGQLRRARQVGLAMLATTPVGAPPLPFAAVWMASGLFDEPSRTTIRLQLPRTAARHHQTSLGPLPHFAAAGAARLVGYARHAMGAP